MKTDSFHCLALAGGSTGGCSRQEPVSATEAAMSHHEHQPPNGGTPAATNKQRLVFWFCTLLSVLDSGLPCQIARGQPVRGSLIGSLPPTNSMATNELSPKPAAQSALDTRAITGEMKGGYLQIGFDKLARFWVNLKYVPVKSDPPSPIHQLAPTLASPIPDAIRALDNKKVAVRGFLLPLKADAGLTTEFILLRNQSMCCYGKPPQVNEWMHVRMTGKGVRAIMDQPMTICGTLHVAEYLENKQILGVYQMDGDKMEEPEESR